MTGPLANGVLILNLAFPIPAAVENPPHFHDVAYDNVKDPKITHLNPVIGILALLDRMIRLKRFRAGQLFLNSGFDKRKRHSRTVPQFWDWFIMVSRNAASALRCSGFRRSI